MAVNSKVENIKDFSGKEVRTISYRVKARSGQVYVLITCEIGSERWQFEVKNYNGHSTNMLDNAFRVTYEDALKSRCELIGYAPTVPFAKRLCANYASSKAI